MIAIKLVVLFGFILFLSVGCSKDTNNPLSGSKTDNLSGTKTQNYSNLLIDKGNYYSFCGDIILSKSNPDRMKLIEALQNPELVRSNNQILAKTSGLEQTFVRRYPDGLVRYHTLGFSAVEEGVIQEAMVQLRVHCGIRFLKTSINYDYLIKKISNSTIGGESDLGYSTYGSECRIADVQADVVIHEFMHGLGISHEHQRPDASSYITLNTGNIQEGFKNQFDPIPSWLCTKYGPYDYKSIMHYWSRAFAKDLTQVTLTKKDGTFINWNYKISYIDAFTLKAMYGSAWSLQSPTVLGTTDNSWEFGTDGASNLYIIKKNYTGSGKTEVHVLTRVSNYQRFSIQIATCLAQTGNNWKYLFGDYNGDGYTDILGVCKNSTGSQRTEVHVLDGRYNWQKFLLQAATCLEQTYDNWDFVAGDYNRDRRTDIIGVKKYSTGSGKTEIHVLNAASGYKTFACQSATALNPTNKDWSFVAMDRNRDGNIDVGAINMGLNTGSKHPELHVLNGGSSRFIVFAAQNILPLNEALFDFRFASNAEGDLIMIKTSNTSSGMTEVHIKPNYLL